MLITENMTLEYLAKSKRISASLYRSMKAYEVRTLGEAMAYMPCDWISEKQREELKKIQHELSENIKLLNKLSLTELYLKGLISTRLHNCLNSLGFTGFSQVYKYINSNGGDYSIFLQQRNLGGKCLTEIKDIVSLMKMYDRNDDEAKMMSSEDTTLNQAFDMVPKASKRIDKSTSIEILRDSGYISMRTYNCLDYAELYTIDDIIEYISVTGTTYRLLSIRNFGKKSLSEVQVLLSLIEGDEQKAPLSNAEHDSDVDVSPIDDFTNRYNELVKNDVFKSSIDFFYEANKSKLSVRSARALEANFTSIKEVAGLYLTGLDISNLHYCGKKTYEELHVFIKKLYDYILSLFTSSSEDVEMMLLQNAYPFLTQNEIAFIVDFKKRMSHLPMFFILYHYLIRSNSRFERIFCRYYGLKQVPENLKDISASMNLTFERCRQILKKKELKDSSFMASRTWSNYYFLNDRLFYNKYDYKTMIEDEGLPHLSMSTFMGICSLVTNIYPIQLHKNSDKTYYLSENAYKTFDFKNCIRDIDATLCKRCTENICLPISVFIDSYWLKEPSFNISEIEDIIIYILKEDYGVEIGEDKILYIQQNTLDRSEEIYRIIEEHGEPMHLRQIRESLILRYPELSDMTIEQTRSYAYKHPHVVSLGKSSTYAIDKWELYTGTIRDLLYEILSDEEEPMSIEELYNEVSLIYPNTSIKSITSSMVSDDLRRFVRFVGSYYGVADKKYDDEFVVWDAEAYSRKTFDERIREFETFLRSHRHLPRNDRDNEDEAALCRWYKRVTANDASISSEQQRELFDLLARNADFLVTATEYSFFRYCEEFKAFIEDNMDFPTLETDSAKYGWFMKNKRIYKDFEDRRKAYFEDLIEFLYTYGFEV